MNHDLAMTVVWLFLGLSLSWLSLLIALSVLNTLTEMREIQPKTQRQRGPTRKPFWQRWFKGMQLPGSQAVPTPTPTPQVMNGSPSPGLATETAPAFARIDPPLACELEVRSLSISPSCCLLHTKQGTPLHGGAISTRLTRLRRLGVLV